MKKPAAIPVITVEYANNVHRLMATSYHQAAPAGERLFRGHPHPVIRFEHTDAASAEKDAGTLRQYLEDCANGKRKDVEPQRKGWWED